jgi:hypothetical protein
LKVTRARAGSPHKKPCNAGDAANPERTCERPAIGAIATGAEGGMPRGAAHVAKFRSPTGYGDAWLGSALNGDRAAFYAPDRCWAAPAIVDPDATPCFYSNGVRRNCRQPPPRAAQFIHANDVAGGSKPNRRDPRGPLQDRRGTRDLAREGMESVRKATPTCRNATARGSRTASAWHIPTLPGAQTVAPRRHIRCQPDASGMEAERRRRLRLRALARQPGP